MRISTRPGRRPMALPRAGTLALLALASCQEAPIAWTDARPLSESLATATRFAFAGEALVAMPPDTSVMPPVQPGQCRESIRVARDTTGEYYAVWWSARPDSTAEIVVARSAAGTAWEAAVRVDTLDAGRTGCRRPPPAIDAFGGHVHVAYSMAAREGPGIFASHSMDRGALFHTPVAVVYGERIGEAAIAARGNDVAIAFEDPNSPVDHIGLAYSNTMAHLFQHRETVTPTAGNARRPRVALGPGKIAVVWTRMTGGQMGPQVRMGDIR